MALRLLLPSSVAFIPVLHVSLKVSESVSRETQLPWVPSTIKAYNVVSKMLDGRVVLSDLHTDG